MCVCMCVHACMWCAYMYVVCACLCAYAYVCVHMRMRALLCEDVCVHVCMCVYVHRAHARHWDVQTGRGNGVCVQRRRMHAHTNARTYARTYVCTPAHVATVSACPKSTCKLHVAHTCM